MADDLAHQNLLALKTKSFDIKFDLGSSNYRAIENIGTGAYGVVCSAEHVLNKKKVAIKKIPDIFEQPTIAKRTYREIRILKHFKHDNVIAIRDILKPEGQNESLRDVYIVLDLMETDMHRIIHSKQEITDEHVRYFLYQILRGLKYIHSANVIHRDLKPSNLLVNENCDVKIGDFGMARGIFSAPDDYNLMMTQYVATRWYRAPELLMARVAYTGAVDMWSVGCILAEMLGRAQIFPGKDYIHQLKLIIGIMGSPTPDFLQIIQAPAIRTFIDSWGVKKAVPLQKLYPKAPPLAIDLLTKTLTLNPQKRVSVEQALSHPFLKKYHDPQDEPCCVPAFNFDFEKKDMSPQDLKAAILKEIQDYHPVSEKPKIAFNFRPVPKSEILSKSASPKKKSPGTKADAFITCDGDSNFGLNAFLSQIRQTGGKEDTENKPRQEVKKPSDREFTGSGQPLSFLTANSPKEYFKVPQAVFKEDQKLQVKQETEDVLMLSAKSEMKVTTEGGHSDVEMLSANKLEPQLSQQISQSNQEVKVEDKPEEKNVNTKEVLKAAILNAALRKQKGDSVQKRSKTALQIQREREEKKRKKAEKAQERRKKKQRDKEKEGQGITLSDADKSLLERWTTMQQRPAKAATATALTDLPGQPGKVSESNNTRTTEPGMDSVSGTASNPLPASTTNTTAGEGRKFSQEGVNEVISELPQGIHENRSNLSQQQVFNPLLSQLSNPVTNPNFVFQPNHTGLSTQPNPEVTARNNNTTKEVSDPHKPQVIDLVSPENKITSELPKSGSDSSFPCSSGMYNYDLPGMSTLDTELKANNQTLDEILDHLVPGDKLPPTYSEALQAKIFTQSPPHLVQDHSSKVTKDAFLPFQTYSPTDNSLHSVCSPETTDLHHQTSTSGAADQKEEGNMLSIITRQMMRSQMQDLTLTDTPKGTGGTGYGVGFDLESLMEEESKTMPMDRSAPLSATESLIGDWLEVSGMKTLDSKEYEALERELGLESPMLNINDLVTSP